jgi:hypothetical protein
MHPMLAGGPFVTRLTILSALLMVGIDWLNLPTVAVIGMTFLSGLALGASRTPRDVMVKDAAPPGQIGKVFGFVGAGLPLGSAMTPVPFGILIDKGHLELGPGRGYPAAQPAIRGLGACFGPNRRGRGATGGVVVRGWIT